MKTVLVILVIMSLSMTMAYATVSAAIKLDHIPETVRENNLVKISGQMLKLDGTPISNHTIFIKDDIPYDEHDVIIGIAKTDDNGRFSSIWKAAVKSDADDYDIYAVYLGGNTYGFTKSNTLVVNVIPSKTPDQNQSFAKLPDWFMDSSKLWYDGQIKDSRFVYGIENLMDQDIILRHEKDDGVHIPQWIKTDTNMYVNGSITEDDFLNMLQYLVDNGILKV